LGAEEWRSVLTGDRDDGEGVREASVPGTLPGPESTPPVLVTSTAAMVAAKTRNGRSAP